jgi:hypothetical protein
MKKKGMFLVLAIISYFGYCFGQQNSNSFYKLFEKRVHFPVNYNFLNYEKVVKNKVIINFMPFEKNEKNDVEYRTGVFIDYKGLKIVTVNKIYLDGDGIDNLEATHILLCIFDKFGKIIDSKQIARNAEDEENKIQILQGNFFKVETNKHQIDLKKGQIVATKKIVTNYIIDSTGKIKPSK